MAAIRFPKAEVVLCQPWKVIQGHRGRYQSKARMRIPISDYIVIVIDILSRTVSGFS